MKLLAYYFHPSVYSLPTYLGIFALLLLPSMVAFRLLDAAGETDIPSSQSRIKSQIEKPIGKILVNKTTVANNHDTITFTTFAQAKEGKIEYVRYYLLNPTLAMNNDWASPDWCSCGRVCGVSDPCTMKTWDIGESGDNMRNYAITWGQETTSGLSTQVSRKLIPLNVPPGTYDVYIQIKDTAGNINEAADIVKITVTSTASVSLESNVLGAESSPDLAITNCGSDEGNGLYSFDIVESSLLAGPVSHAYQIDQGAWVPFNDTRLVLQSAGGGHYFAVQTTDATGQIAVARCSFEVK